MRDKNREKFWFECKISTTTLVFQHLASKSCYSGEVVEPLEAAQWEEVGLQAVGLKDSRAQLQF